MTMQEMFDKIWDYFIVQGKPAGLDGNGACTYYGNEGANRCAVGCLLPDEVAKRIPNGLSAIGIVRAANRGNLQTSLGGTFIRPEIHEASKLAAAALLGDSASAAIENYENSDAVKFLSSAQMAHDESSRSSEFADRFKGRLLSLAYRFGLNIPAEAAA